jgi:hypothetical protein
MSYLSAVTPFMYRKCEGMGVKTSDSRSRRSGYASLLCRIRICLNDIPVFPARSHNDGDLSLLTTSAIHPANWLHRFLMII